MDSNPLDDPTPQHLAPPPPSATHVLAAPRFDPAHNTQILRPTCTAVPFRKPAPWFACCLRCDPDLLICIVNPRPRFSSAATRLAMRPTLNILTPFIHPSIKSIHPCIKAEQLTSIQNGLFILALPLEGLCLSLPSLLEHSLAAANSIASSSSLLFSSSHSPSLPCTSALRSPIPFSETFQAAIRLRALYLSFFCSDPAHSRVLLRSIDSLSLSLFAVGGFGVTSRN
ncbi:uncharacterized protein [Physcomitrium patens]|uniref:uncharacterized protein n=1 Tax=Physcomitrium patens TaxID=3218 RepID=UPI003CCD337F